MNTPTKELEKTAILSGNETGRKKTRRNNPKLFVCCETDIFMYDLDGEQMIGRPTGQLFRVSSSSSSPEASTNSRKFKGYICSLFTFPTGKEIASLFSTTPSSEPAQAI